MLHLFIIGNCGTWRLQGWGSSRHNCRYPRLSQCESRKIERSPCFGTQISANFFPKSSHEKHLNEIYLIPRGKSGHYHMEKSLDLRTWLSEQGKILNKDAMARSKINISLLIQLGDFESTHETFSPLNLNLCLCIYLTAVNVYLRQFWFFASMVLSGALGTSLHLHMHISILRCIKHTQTVTDPHFTLLK